jgi:predicted ATPase/DNA-binding CsgD family transcriptional regulator
VSSARDTSRAPGNLPSELSSFVGRTGELQRLARAASGVRLLTLVGPGGVGKSRLALRLARRLSSNHPDGIWLVDLASVTHPDHLPQAVGDVLGLRQLSPRPWVTALGSKLRDRTLLLILDNCEHLLAGSADLASTLLEAYPRVHVLATSRRPLGVSGEYSWSVPPLSLPRSATAEREEVESSEAVRLFVARARIRAPQFTLTERNLRLVADICRHLDGLPLALELAAAHVEGMDLADIASRVTTGLALRIRGPRTAHPRQQTLHASLDWSCALLTEPERVLFRRLAVFAACWTLEGARFVVSDAALPSTSVGALLERLVSSSLVMMSTGSGAVRFGMLETVRHYAREQLVEAHEADRLRTRHAEYLVQLAELYEPELMTAEHAALLKVEQHEIRAALNWALESREAELGVRLVEAVGRSVAGERPAEAVRLAASAAALRTKLGVSGWPRDTRRSPAWLADAQIALGRSDYQSAWSAGHGLSEADTLKLVEAVLSRPSAPVEGPIGQLTQREMEVAVLLAGGMSTAEIARELVVSVATVRVHVEHILGKLDLHSRTQLVLWVREHGTTHQMAVTRAARRAGDHRPGQRSHLLTRP